MKCTHCGEVLASSVYIITLVAASGDSYVCNLHPRCLVAMTSSSGEGRVLAACMRSGWTQRHLPADWTSTET